MGRHAQPTKRRPLLLPALLGGALGALVAVLRRWGGDTSCLDATDGALRQCAAPTPAWWAVVLAALMGAALAVALARRRR